MENRSRAWRWIVGLDQALNPIIFDGSEDVTLSAQLAYRELLQGKSRWWRKFVDRIFKFFGEANHCYDSLLFEIDEFPGEQDRIREELKKLGIE